MASSLIVAASALLSFAAAAPIQDGIRSGSLEARQAPNCNIGIAVNNATAYDSSCWDTLNIMPYLTNWKTTTPTCTDAENSAAQTLGCCVASEPWSTCFLRLATRQANAYDCTQIATVTCSYPANLDPGLDPTIASQVNYIVLNIMMINSFFVTYYQALQTVMAQEGQALNSFLSSSGFNQLNPNNVNVNTQNIMAALTLGLAFPKFSQPTSATAAATTNGNGAAAINNVDSTTTSTTFGNIKRDLQDLNTGTSTGSAPQSSASGCGYGYTVKYFTDGRHHRRQEPCSNVTAEGESNDGAEADLNASGPWPLDLNSVPVSIFNEALQQSPNVASAMWPSLPNSATDTLAQLASGQLDASPLLPPILNAGLQLIMGDIGTFIAFAGHGMFSFPFYAGDQASGYNSGFTGALDTYIFSEILSRNSISATPGQIIPANPCASGAALCDTYFWSPVTQRQYTFTGEDTFSLFHHALSGLEVDLPTLFDGAYNCTFAGQAGGSVVSLQADNSLNVACLSVLPMYIQGDCPQGATQVDGKCPFGSSGSAVAKSIF